ncbi:MAG: flagellar protein FliS [Lachnospiraceae bacterium]|nr:flagellar protein FliS [Lachnospiraceae bacterium]
MTSELKQKYTLRITQANKTEMIVILYDMLLDYIKDAKAVLELDNKEQFHKEIKHARGCVEELIASLNLEYELARNYLQLYSYVNRELASADAGNHIKALENAQMVISELKEAYVEISKQDTSPAVMSNTQSVYAGLTYGKTDLKEDLMNHSGNRGFLV